MKIKRYIAGTMREAMRLVKKEHGDDAVILSTKDTDEGVEVVAALDPEIEEYRQPTYATADSSQDAYVNLSGVNQPHKQAAFTETQPMFEQTLQDESMRMAADTPYSANTAKASSLTPNMRAYQSTNRMAQADPNSMSEMPKNYPASPSVAQTVTANQTSPAVGSAAEMQKLFDEMTAMRKLLENEMAGLAWGQMENSSPEKVDLIKRLLNLGISWSLSQKLLEKVDSSKESAWAELLGLIEADIQCEEQDLIEKGGIYAFVGPTGVGKTTTIAKLASRFVMRNSPNDIALISTDGYKVGAQAQLKLFADLISVPVHVAHSQQELYNLLGSLANKKLVLIDTAGMSQKAIQFSQQITSAQSASVPIKNYLVMSATTQLTVMQQIVQSFNQVVLSGCILTKVDEAGSLGNILSVLVERQLPIAYLSNGQRVPEDIESVRARNLLDQAIVLGRQNAISHDDQAFRMGVAKEISNAQ